MLNSKEDANSHYEDYKNSVVMCLLCSKKVLRDKINNDNTKN